MGLRQIRPVFQEGEGQFMRLRPDDPAGDAIFMVLIVHPDQIKAELVVKGQGHRLMGRQPQPARTDIQHVIASAILVHGNPAITDDAFNPTRNQEDNNNQDDRF